MSQGRDLSNAAAVKPPPATAEHDKQKGPAETSQPGIPSIALPKGGGAIRGIGEKFGVNPATGTGSLTVPLATSPGRSGFGPSLALSYDSGSGNGPFGLGWSLSLPALTRKTDKGLPRYLDDDESDVFLVSGAEDLVPILDNGGNRFSLSRTVHGVAYRIHLYRPRIEGMFSRIERWARVDNQVSHWRTITRNNVTTMYGFDENSRIVDPRDERRVFSFLICLTFDDKGNAVQYEYAIDDFAGINRAAAHEANRSDLDRRTQRYLKYVRYGNTQPYFPDWLPDGQGTPVPNNWHFQVVFDYGDHRPDAPTPTRDPAVDPAWPLRPDPFSVFRSGFEVRTYRRCERVLLFHQFQGQAGFEQPCLIRSTDFQYSDETTPVDPRNPIYTFMESATQTGYRRHAGGYDQRSTPPIEFFYSQPEVHPEILTLDDTDSRENFPEGLDGSRFQWIDLDGEGLTGILTEENGGWGYKRNLSPINEVTGADGERLTRARFGPVESIPLLPVPASLGGGHQLLDLTGEGRPDLVAFDAAVPGYFARTGDEDWEPLRTFASLPRLNWSEPNLKFVDLTGDGRADVLITEDEVFTFYASLGEDGFAEANRVITSSDEERGPRVVFSDGTQTVLLADLSGDGLSDMVRIRNGEVCYWPNLGYGHFGPKVTMDDAPRFADEDAFDPRRIRLADIDGSGTTDILYVGNEGVLVCFNRSGNSWAEPHLLAMFPGADNLSSVQAIDLLSNGTACLVWSSPLPAESYAPLRYVDLMGSQKPHLMVRSRNNLGAETRVSYAASTRFYLEDKRSGKPWITRLPFPVQVVERVETYDWIGRSRFITRYAYHHGYFDGEDREFRGFGMIEQFDTETHRDDNLFPEVVPLNEEAASFIPPMLTKTWFHTGAFVEAGTASQQYAHEYWVEPALRDDSPASVAARAAMLLPDTSIDDPLAGPIGTDEIRDAYRALKGSPLRIEIYSQDKTPRAEHPYAVTEQNFSVRRLQPRGSNHHAVFVTHPRESLSYHYERRPEDPRLSHNLTLEVDEFCQVLRSVSIGYGRRAGFPEPEPNLSASFRGMLNHDQTRTHIAASQNTFTFPVKHPAEATIFDAYRAPLPAETITAELTGIAPVATRFEFDELDAHFTNLWGGANDIPYEEVSTADIDGVAAAGGPARRVVERTRTLYRSDDLTALLPLRTAGSNGLAGESYHLVLTPGLITRVFGARVTDAILIEGGYFRPAGETDWWIPSGRNFYSAGDGDSPAQELAEAKAHFYRPRRTVDPFGAIARVAYDAFDLLPANTADALGNVNSAVNDYRVLRATQATDPNGNQTAAAFDILGEIAGLAISGKAGEGDSLNGFETDLTDIALAGIRADPLNRPDAILQNATSRFTYDLFAYLRTRDQPNPEPPFLYTLTRETHVSDLAQGEETRFQHSFAYSDGFGREIQHKVQAEAGPIEGVGDDVSVRWVGSGWTILNNKGKPVRNYEPFFTQTHRFEFDRQVGVSSVIFYDPIDRVVSTLHPDNTFEKTVFDSWQQQTWDVNDTVLISDPRTDADVGDFFQRLLGNAAGAFVSWHDARIGGALGDTPEERAANQSAAQKAAAHAATPTLVHFDALGRTSLSVVDNGIEAGIPQRFATRTAQDAEGKPLAVFDAQGRRVMEYCLREPTGGGGFRYVAGFDIAGRPLFHNGMDGGGLRKLDDIASNPLRHWTARGFVFRMRYDLLRRPTHRYVSVAFGEILLERLIYGEKHPDATLNLKGRPFRHYDSAGVAGNERYDFKGNLSENTRQFARIVPPNAPASFYETAPDWTPLADIDNTAVLDLAAIDAAAVPLLEVADRFTAFTRFDALNRPVQMVTPHQANNRPSVIQPIYNEAKLLERVNVWIRQNAAPGNLLVPATADLNAVADIDYNARGQRVSSALGNGVITDYDYDEQTFRLTKLISTRPNTFPEAARSVQDLAYHYDAAGNVMRIRDSADIQNVVYFRNQRVEPTVDYTYDPIYRLTNAAGREHLGQTNGVLNAPVQVTNDDSSRTHSAPNIRRLNPGDGNAMGNYTERYEYDSAGNLLRMIHQAANGSWTRRYSYNEISQIDPAETNNRLSANSLPGDNPLGPYSARYVYDAHGNMTQMPHLPSSTWDASDRLESTTRQSVNDGMPETTYYVYDGSGERVRKVTFNSAVNGETPVIKSERLYFDDFEVYREYDNAAAVSKERETVHVMDDHQRITMVETRTIGQDPSPPQLVRYQFSNHLGSTLLELDHAADVISYEEYFPYGSTSYQAVRNQTDTPKRYRFTAKERDEENDLYYHGARYYAPWLGRWTSCDPAGLEDGLNLYAYVRSSPSRLVDDSGEGAKEVRLGQSLETASERHQKGANELRKQKDLNEINVKRREGVGGKRETIPDEVKSSAETGKPKLVVETKARHVKSGRNQTAGQRRADIKQNLEQVKDQLQKLEQAGEIGPDTKGKALRVVHDSDKGKSAKKALPTWQKEGKDVRQKWVAEATDPIEKAARERVNVVTTTRDKVSKATKAVEHSVEKNKKLASAGAEALEKSGKGVKALAKLGKAGRHFAAAIPIAGIVLGQASAAHAASQGDYTGAVLDEVGFIPVVGDVLDAARGGVALGEALDEGLGISDVAAEHGMKFEAAAKSVGLGEDSSRIVGAAGAALSSITVAPQIALQRTVAGWFK
jgi:RHS repeat-associated protein